MRALPVVFALVLCGSALAAPATTPERQTLEQFGRNTPSCAEWTDGCAVCMRQTDGSLGCSLPGISCQPAAPRCTVPAGAPKK